MFTFENVLSFAALLNANLFHILTFDKQLTINTESVDNDKSDKKLVTHLTRATAGAQGVYIKNELEIACGKTRTGLCTHGNFWTSLSISRV